MSSTWVVVEKRPRLKKPVLVEGLPGVGLVGRLAAEQLVNELDAKPFAVMHSSHFPPQVIVDEDAEISMFENTFYYWKNKKGKNDLVILMGDHQGLSVESHYEVSKEAVDLAHKLGVKTIYTLGGFRTGKIVKNPRVFGAVTDSRMRRTLEKHGVVFAGGPQFIAGAAGLMLGLGKLKGMRGACLMGETHGAYADPHSAEYVLKILTEVLKIKISYQGLEEMAKEIDKELERIRKAQKKQEEELRRMHESALKDRMSYFR